jgi:hypothetical protein
MKYIRTEKGIYEVVGADSCSYLNAPPEMYYITSDNKNILKSKVIAQADNIIELCDVFIFKDTCSNEWHIVNQNDGISMLGASLFSDTLRGYIETEKGLMPVAKMNKKKEFQLL